ncbi:hypothetical protein FHG87_013244 [Trinorchestia longiramus]|nr:hypothetical protein FHG87_013244 [Trinorchestia longiramus]
MPPPPHWGRGAASGRASSSSRPSRAPLLPQSQSSSKTGTSSSATAISSQPSPTVPNPKPLTTLLPQPLPSTPAILPSCKSTHVPHRTLAANCPYRKNIIRQKEDTEQRQKQEQTHSTYAEIAKHAIQQTDPPQHTLTLTNQTHIELTALILEAHIAALDKTKKIREILLQFLKLNFNIDTTFPDRDSTAIFNFYYDKTDSQQHQTTQTASQEEHTKDETIDTAMDETGAATYTEIRQKRRISDGMEDSKLLIVNNHTTYAKLYRNYADSSPIPDNPTKDWFANELDKDQDNGKGLKLFTQDLDHQLDQVLRVTFDKVQTLQQKNVFLLVDEVQIRPTVSISGWLLSGMAENNQDCKATSILITRTRDSSQNRKEAALETRHETAFTGPETALKTGVEAAVKTGLETTLKTGIAAALKDS